MVRAAWLALEVQPPAEHDPATGGLSIFRDIRARHHAEGTDRASQKGERWVIEGDVVEEIVSVCGEIQFKAFVDGDDLSRG